MLLVPYAAARVHSFHYSLSSRRSSFRGFSCPSRHVHPLYQCACVVLIIHYNQLSVWLWSVPHESGHIFWFLGITHSFNSQRLAVCVSFTSFSGYHLLSPIANSLLFYSMGFICIVSLFVANLQFLQTSFKVFQAPSVSFHSLAGIHSIISCVSSCIMSSVFTCIFPHRCVPGCFGACAIGYRGVCLLMVSFLAALNQIEPLSFGFFCSRRCGSHAGTIVPGSGVGESASLGGPGHRG